MAQAAFPQQENIEGEGHAGEDSDSHTLQALVLPGLIEADDARRADRQAEKLTAVEFGAEKEGAQHHDGYGIGKVQCRGQA